MKDREYHYTECGLDNIYLVNGFDIDSEGNLTINDIHGLHKAIGRLLVTKPDLLSGKEIRFIRHTLDLSQTSLAKILGVSYQSVLRWETEKGTIQRTEDLFLKTLFLVYLNNSKGKVIYDKINELADLDAEDVKKKKITKIRMEESTTSWRNAA